MQPKRSRVHDLLEGLRDSGDLKLLLDLGFITWKTYMYLDICEYYDKRLKIGDGKMKAVYTTAETFNVDIATVYRSLKKLQYEYWNFNTNDQRKRRISKTGDEFDKRTDC